ncbi:ATP-binding protein [Pseudoteredinibacter isoporae]|uniref:histidine kinase n=1 Tax=Pseudoteredinibacter isoporae TaxID=570281 RepID=A0A7X0MWV6_9GAMM|nr:ATP-binding protein [Pseudoteredinibacter isoporae]MBB6522630.1 two-component system sensor histidine kinase BaeS [Pseudoteredinibacter isoporae]NHO88160.1 HAMP domain-containing protein [Pseudoteredinibacter isoporae]NIB23509.1 HAMP domain-containing protein [Pseudoteredinibacter isoporae]
MKIKLQGKLFLAFSLATASVILFVAWFAYWNFDRGFREYLNQAAIERTEPIRNALVEHYREKGSWQDLKDNPRLMRRIIYQTFNVERQRRFQEKTGRPLPPGLNKSEDKHRRKIFERHFREARFLRIYDEQGELLISSPKWPVVSDDPKKASQNRDGLHDELRVSLKLDGETIGSFAIRKAKLQKNRPDYEFRRKQLHKIWVAVGFALIVSGLLAWLLARHLISPIRDLAEGSKSLGEGDYSRRVEVRGNDELASLGRDFNQLALTLEKNEQSRQQWIADISHELRTPLAVLRGEIEAVLDGVRKFNADNVQSLHAEVLALSRLVDDLYQLALSDAGALDYRFARENARELLELSLDAFELRFKKANLNLHADGLENLNSYIRADRKRFAQLMHNLLENSLRYTDAGGEAMLTAEAVANELKITLQDSSPSVSAADMPKIFERLYRVDQSRSREHGGSGLGLSLCQNIVEAHGGRIDAAPSDLGGLKITLYMPNYEN